jgi:hypothetical protein
LALQEWRQEFKKRNGGREPRLWIDKYCFDQENMDSALARLPVYLAGCAKLVVLCGNTYLSRLWCLVEMLVFMHLGKSIHKLEVKFLSDSVSKRHSIERVKTSVENFDVMKAKCLFDDDARRLWRVMDSVGHDQISQLVQGILAERLTGNP